MGRPATARKCPTCMRPGLKRNGRRGGRIRWRCTKCGASSSGHRPDITELSQFEGFLKWIQGKHCQSEFDQTTTGRTLRRRIQWCWKVPVPKPPLTGEIYDQIFIDGTYLAYGWCLLVATSSANTVITWVWCHSENSASYTNLFTTIPPPLIVTTDGHGGALKAIKECWPEANIQRCLIHVHRNNVGDLTQNPKTNAGKALLGLSKQLLAVETLEDATKWVTLLSAFHTEYAAYLKQRTYAKDDPQEAVKRGKKPNGWWYTHGRDRRVYNRLNRLYKKGQLFTFLTTEPGRVFERTTNPVESLNNQVKSVIKNHCGLSQDHLTCAIEWVLYKYIDNPQTPRQIINNWNKQNRPTRTVIPKKHHQPKHEGPKQYDTGLEPDEGLWTRKGWAGRAL